MKHNWTYKKLGDVCKVNSGKGIAAKLISSNYSPSLVPCYGGNGIRGYVQTPSHNGVHPIIGRVGALCGNVHLAKGEFYATEHALIVTITDNGVNPEWLSFLLKHKDLSKIAKGVAQPVISASEVMKQELPVPSLDEQQAIVRELDGINRLIDLQEEQLREYDRLAQSLFYTTFGDPATNPKGWEVKKLGEILSYIKNGANIKQTRGAGGLPITRIETLSGGVFNRDRLGYADITDLSKYANFYLETGDLLMSHINSKTYIGRTVMYEKEGDETIIHGMNLLRLKVVRDIVNPVYVCYYCKTDRFKGDVAKIRKDAVNQSSICISDIVRISLPLPPLALQQTFAAQIEAIEQQKALVRKSLEDTRTLLAARMQYYFE